MAHGTLHKDLDVDREYRLLQERLDRNVTGAPDSAAMRRVLRMLFSPEEAHVARSLPQLIPLPKLAEKLDVDVDALDELIRSRPHLVSDVLSIGIPILLDSGEESALA